MNSRDFLRCLPDFPRLIFRKHDNRRMRVKGACKLFRPSFPDVYLVNDVALQDAFPQSLSPHVPKDRLSSEIDREYHFCSQVF